MPFMLVTRDKGENKIDVRSQDEWMYQLKPRNGLLLF